MEIKCLCLIIQDALIHDRFDTVNLPINFLTNLELLSFPSGR